MKCPLLGYLNLLKYLQEFELCKALEDNQKLIEKRLSKKSPAEVKLSQEIDKLTERLTQLNSDLSKVLETSTRFDFI